MLKILVNEGCPQKFISVWQAKEGIRSGFRDKFWLVLNSSGNFLFNGYKNLRFLSKNEWEKGVQRCLPISYRQKVGKKATFGFKVKIFNLNFHSFPLTNLGNISAYQIENFLYFSKHYLLFILVALWREL